MSAFGPAQLRAISWARDIIARDDVVFLDTETTGLGPDAEIIDIAIINREGDVLLAVFIEPDGPIPAEASAVHGITSELVAGCWKWPNLWPLIAEVLAGKTVVTYNAKFDASMIDQVCRRHRLGVTVTGDLWQCAMLAYSEFDGTPGYDGTPKWRRLDHAAARFGIPPGGHRALADAETARQVVIAMANARVTPDGQLTLGVG